MNWELLWKAVLIGTVGLFAVMSVFVTILGARDIKRLLNQLEDQIDDPQDNSSHH